MTISFQLRKLIYEKLSEGKHKDDIALTYNVSLRAVYDIGKQGIAGIPPSKRLLKKRMSKELILRTVKPLQQTKQRAPCTKSLKKLSYCYPKPQ